MNLTDISTQMLYTTVPVWVRFDGGQRFGTAFVYSVPIEGQPDRQFPLLISNYHVLEGARNARVEFAERDGDTPKRGTPIRVDIPGEFVLKHTDPKHDLVAIPIGAMLNSLEQSGRPAFFRSISPDLVPSEEVADDLAALEEITFIGYPSGLYDAHNVTPLIRRGITATPPWNDFGGESAFLIDAGVFPGSSGSPVFILNQGAYATRQGLTVGNRLIFMGVLTGAMLRQESGLSDVFLGIGKVIKSHAVRRFTAEVTASLTRGA